MLERAPGDSGEIRYRNAPVADRHLVRGKPTYVGGFLERANHNLYPAWGRLTAALRTGEPQAESDFMEMIKDPNKLRRFAGMMDALTDLVGPELAQAFDWSAYGTVLDVGGCRGNLLSHLLKQHTELRGTVFDLPEMAPLFAEHTAGLGLNERATFAGGSFFTDPLPATDVVVIGHVLHDWDAAERRAITEKAYAAVRPGGAILIYDRMLDDPPTNRENLIISLDMLLTTQGGAEYPVSECVTTLTELGCAEVVAQPLSDHDTLVIGKLLADLAVSPVDLALCQGTDRDPIDESPCTTARSTGEGDPRRCGPAGRRAAWRSGPGRPGRRPRPAAPCRTAARRSPAAPGRRRARSCAVRSPVDQRVRRVQLEDPLDPRHLLAHRPVHLLQRRGDVVGVADQAGRRGGQPVRQPHLLDLLVERAR